MHRRAGSLCFVLLLFCLDVCQALGGDSSDLKGKVTDRLGKPLPGATVVVKNDTLAVAEKGVVSDAAGNYRIPRLPPGPHYRVRVALTTYAPVEFSDLELVAGKSYTLDVVLSPASEMKEVLRVQGHADLVDTESVVTSTTFSSEFISGLPVLGRDYQDILSLAPGVTDVDGTGNPNIHGARDTDVITLVDGVNTTDPFTGYFGQQLNIESIEQIEVITSGATAEFGRAQGGFANIITKSGGNEFQGNFKFFMRTDRLDGDGAGIDPPEVHGGLGEVNGLRELSFSDYYPFLSLSGPILRDKVWYYVATEFIQVETPINAVSQAFVTRTRGFRNFGKATWQINQAHKLTFSIAVDRTRDENQGLDSLTAVESGFQFERGGPTYTLKETAVFSPVYLLESSLSWFDNAFQRAPTLDPDTNGNGILFVDDRPDLGGNQDGFFQASERDPGEDNDRDLAFDLFEDFNHNGRLDVLIGEDRDKDGRLTPPGGCEGESHEDVNCNGFLDQEYDLNEDGIVQPDEDRGLPGIPGTAGNGRIDSEDINRNNLLDTVGNSGQTPFPFWSDTNGNHRVDPGEYLAPLFPDRDFTRTNGATIGPNPFEFEDHRKRLSLREDFSIYVDASGGTHDLKVGMLYEHEAFDRQTEKRPILDVKVGFGSGNTVSVHLPTLPSVNNTATGDNLAFYIQDTFKPLPNLTLGLGIRLDLEDLSSFGHTLFDPAAERRVYDRLIGITGVEHGGIGEQDFDGITSLGLEASDPLYQVNGGGDHLHLAQITGSLFSIAPRRFTGHEVQVPIESAYLANVLGREPTAADLARNGFNVRQPEEVNIQNANVAPRLSISWDPWADGKSKAFGSWNRFYDKLFLNTMVLEEGPDTITRYYAFDPNGVDFQGKPNNQLGDPLSQAPPTATQIERDLSTPYTDELTLGFERELAPELSLSVTYIRRDFRHQLQNVDLNHNTRIDPETGRLQDKFGIDSPPPGGGFGDESTGRGERSVDGKPDLYIQNIMFNRVFRMGNYNDQSYRALELEMVRRLSRKWQMNGSYTYSRSQGDAESFLSDVGDDPTLTEYESGFLNYDQRHVLKLNATAFLPGDWQIGGTAQWASGLPYSFIQDFNAQDNVGYIQSRKRFGYTDRLGVFQGENRNDHRNHAAYVFNARARKSFVMGKAAAGAFFEVFNILNSDDLRVYTINPEGRFDSNGRIIFQSNEVRQFGRRFQFGIQIDF
jgi:outer membrane receptor protein involved in Fe transport